MDSRNVKINQQKFFLLLAIFQIHNLLRQFSDPEYDSHSYLFSSPLSIFIYLLLKLIFNVLFLLKQLLLFTIYNIPTISYCLCSPFLKPLILHFILW